MKTKTEILNNYSKEVGLIDFKNAVKHVWLKQWSCTALIRLVEKAMEEYASQSRDTISDSDIEKYAKSEVPFGDTDWSYKTGKREGIYIGAKAMRDGKIKPPLEAEKEKEIKTYTSFLDNNTYTTTI